MHQTTKLNIIRSGLLLALTVMMSSVAVAGTQSRSRTVDPWNVLKGYSLSSVVWSPKGDYIAFVAASDKDDTDGGLLRASIWLMSLPKQGQIVKLRRLTIMTRKQGIPAALFWLDNNRIGWAASGVDTYTFWQMGLNGSKPKRLVNRSFTGDVGDSGPHSAPEDVYYDANSRTLIFGGTLYSKAYVRTLTLSTGKVRNMFIPHPEGLVYPKGYISYVTLCGSIKHSQKPQFYIAASIMSEWKADSRSGLWRSDSYSLKQDKIIINAPHQGFSYPRTSPDGKSLTYVQNDEIILHDLISGKHKVLVKPSSEWIAYSPADGCQYSWSPDGKMVAYADGSRIKTVKVAGLR